MQAGDVFFVAGTGPISACIRLAQRLRPALRPFCRWTHCGIAISRTDVVEAHFQGVRRVPFAVATGPKEPYRLVPVPMSPEDRREIITYGESVVGEEYGVLQILGIALSLLTAGKLAIGENRHLICSQLVACALERAGYIWDRDPSEITPADVARALKARNP
jgi:uncharacterized protein YycO